MSFYPKYELRRVDNGWILLATRPLQLEHEYAFSTLAEALAKIAELEA